MKKIILSMLMLNITAFSAYAELDQVQVDFSHENGSFLRVVETSQFVDRDSGLIPVLSTDAGDGELVSKLQVHTNSLSQIVGIETQYGTLVHSEYDSIAVKSSALMDYEVVFEDANSAKPSSLLSAQSGRIEIAADMKSSQELIASKAALAQGVSTSAETEARQPEVEAVSSGEDINYGFIEAREYDLKVKPVVASTTELNSKAAGLYQDVITIGFVIP